MSSDSHDDTGSGSPNRRPTENPAMKKHGKQMSRQSSIEAATDFFENGHFLSGLRDLVAIRTESQDPQFRNCLEHYMSSVIADKLRPLGFDWQIYDNPDPAGVPFLVAERFEDRGLPTVLIYGHGDVVPGMEDQWSNDLDPWAVTVVGEKWYGRGTVDNKGQHWTALSAIHCLIADEGRLGFNTRFLLDMSEEIGSPGMHVFCRQHRHVLNADVLIASDGPRLQADRPTIYMGARGNLNFNLRARFRKRNFHSGNWGGVLKDPVIRLSHAIASIADSNGRLLVEGWRPEPPSPAIKEALADCPIGGSDDDTSVDRDWGEPGLTLAERLYAWNSFAVVAISSGDSDNPVNAIQGEAIAACQLRFVVGIEPKSALEDLRAHLDAAGFDDIAIEPNHAVDLAATRQDPDHPWVEFVANSIEDTTGQPPVRLPNLAASLPNDCFSDILGMPTVWIPHSYPECGQHAPDEHALAPILKEGLQIMTGVFWDIGNALPRP